MTQQLVAGQLPWNHSFNLLVEQNNLASQKLIDYWFNQDGYKGYIGLTISLAKPGALMHRLKLLRMRVSGPAQFYLPYPLLPPPPERL